MQAIVEGKENVPKGYSPALYGTGGITTAEQQDWLDDSFRPGVLTLLALGGWCAPTLARGRACAAGEGLALEPAPPPGSPVLDQAQRSDVRRVRSRHDRITSAEVSYEDSPARIYGRLGRMGQTTAAERIHLWTTESGASRQADWWGDLWQYVRGTGARLVIVDPASAAWYDGARGVLSLEEAPDNPGARILECVKATYGRKGWGTILNERTTDGGAFAGLEVESGANRLARVKDWRGETNGNVPDTDFAAVTRDGFDPYEQ